MRQKEERSPVRDGTELRLTPKPEPIAPTATARANCPRRLTRHFRLEENIQLFLGSRQAFRKRPAIVLSHPVLPLEEVGDALRFNTHLDSPQAGEQQIHFIEEARGCAQILR